MRNKDPAFSFLDQNATKWAFWWSWKTNVWSHIFLLHKKTENILTSLVTHGLTFSIICKATTVTHTKRIDRNLLHKETSFMCYTSSVLRKSRHMKQKKKLRTVAKIKTQDYKNWRLQKFFTIVTPPLNTATTLLNEHRSQRPLGTSDWQNILIAFRVVFVSGDHVVCNRP